MLKNYTCNILGCVCHPGADFQIAGTKIWLKKSVGEEKTLLYIVCIDDPQNSKSSLLWKIAHTLTVLNKRRNSKKTRLESWLPKLLALEL